MLRLMHKIYKVVSIVTKIRILKQITTDMFVGEDGRLLYL